MNPVIPYPGGKRRLLPHILPLIPQHRTYLEAFAGGLAVLLAREPSSYEVVNDLDSDLVAFYRCARYHCDALIDELAGYQNGRENFATLLANTGWTDLQRAARWYLLQVGSFGGQAKTFGRNRDSLHGYHKARARESIRRLSTRLADVLIEKGDWEKVVEFFDAPTTFTFFDPPYIECGETAYAPFSVFEMQRLRARLDKMKGTWLLTCDDSQSCREIFDGLPMQRLTIKYSIGTRKSGPPRKESGELLVMHPAIATRAAAA